MKVAISTKLVLVLPNFNEKFVLETDASNYGVRAILMQKEQPLAYFSKKLSLRMQQASAYVRELYAINEAVKKIVSISLGHEVSYMDRPEEFKSFVRLGYSNT